MTICEATGKERHLDRAAAEKALRRCRNKRDARLHVYHCAYCKAFHLASNTRQRG